MHPVGEGEVIFRLGREEIEGIRVPGFVPELRVLRIELEARRIAESGLPEVEIDKSSSGNEVGLLLESRNVVAGVNGGRGIGQAAGADVRQQAADAVTQHKPIAAQMNGSFEMRRGEFATEIALPVLGAVRSLTVEPNRSSVLVGGIEPEA